MVQFEEIGPRNNTNRFAPLLKSTARESPFDLLALFV